MIYLILVFLGLALGSFINALVWRIHELKTNSKMTRKRRKELSIIKGRSMCPSCNHILGAKDLIPVFSWLYLRGKCRYCAKSIPDSPFVEIFMSILLVFLYAFWPRVISGRGLVDFIFWVLIATGLGALFVYDLKWMILPSKIIYPLYILGIISILVDILVFHAGFGLIIQSVFGLLIVGGLFYLLFQISSGKWIGGGDVRLGGLLGFLIGGILPAFLLIFIASLLGCVISIPLLLSKRARANSQIPFGPFLIIAAVVTKLFGLIILNWYKQKFLIF